MAKVSLARLKRLVRLHQKEVPGGRELLEALLEDNHTEVCELLALVGPLTADRVVTRVEKLTVAAKTETMRQAREHSEHLAQQLGLEARLQQNGSWKIHPGQLDELALAGGFTHVAFQGAGTVDLGVLRRVLKSCHSVTLLAIELNSSRLSLRYDGPGTRGRIAILVRPAEPLDDPVTVKLGARSPMATRRRSGGFVDHLEKALLEAVG